MTKTQKKRLQKMAQRIDAMPISHAVEDAAYERFKETGELSEVQKLARACIDRALNYGHPVRNGIRLLDISRRVLERFKEQIKREPGWEPPRKMLFFEAVYGWKAVRGAARSAIKILVAIGRDVADPDFVPEDMELPDWGGVGMHLLGFPERLAKAPYKRQAARLFRRMDALRQRIDRDDRAWGDAYGEAAVRFLHEGGLPDDDLMVEAVVAYGELMGLVAHYVGVGDAEVMEAYDRAARDKRGDRASALGRLLELGAGGGLLPDRSSAPAGGRRV
jgi:hypothetical protein